MLAKFYNKKPDVIEAIQFVYTEEGIEALKHFCGDAFVEVRKDRHIKAVGEAEISGTKKWQRRTSNLIANLLAFEGDFIIKDGQEFSVMGQDTFRNKYEEQH